VTTKTYASRCNKYEGRTERNVVFHPVVVVIFRRISTILFVMLLVTMRATFTYYQHLSFPS